jgi:hypothetical protein
MVSASVVKARSIAAFSLVFCWANAASAGPQSSPPPPSDASPSLADHKAMLERFTERMEQIEGKIVLTKDKVDLLRDSVLAGSSANTKVIIAHKNDMGTGFVLDKVTYTLDGEEILSRENQDGGLDAQKEFEIFNGVLTAGSHELSVQMIYSASSIGVFTYLKGYKFNVNSKYRFSPTDGRLTQINVVSFPRGDITTNTGDRIAVRYDSEVTTLNANGQPVSQPASTDAPKTAPADKPAPDKPATDKPAEPAKTPANP